jgi:hypothetical protein
LRHHQVEGVFDCLGAPQKQRALSQVVDHEGREHDNDPSQLNGAFTEVAKVRIEGFSTGDGEKHGAERDKADDAV